MAKTKYPYYVPVINWNGRLVKLSNRKYSSVNDAEVRINKVIEGWVDSYDDSPWVKGLVDEYNRIKQLLIIKYDSSCSPVYTGGHTTVVRFYNDGKLIFSLE